MARGAPVYTIYEDVEHRVLCTYMQDTKIGSYTRKHVDLEKDFGKHIIREHGAVLKEMQSPSWSFFTEGWMLPPLTRAFYQSLTDEGLKPYKTKPEVDGALETLRHLTAHRILAEKGEFIRKSLEEPTPGLHGEDLLEDVVNQFNEAVQSLRRFDETDPRIYTTNKKSPYFEASRTIMKNVLAAKPEDNFILTGIKAHDTENIGLPRRGVMVIAADSGGGKSVVAQNLAMNMAANGHSVAFATLENSIEQNARRLLARVSGVTLTDLMRGALTEKQQAECLAAHDAYMNSVAENGGEFFMEDPKASLAIESILQRLLNCNTRRSDVIFVDYIGLLEMNVELQAVSLGQIVRYAKIFSGNNNCLVILLAQFDREKNQVRYARAIQEHADVMWTWVKDPAVPVVNVCMAKGRESPRKPFQMFIDTSIMTARDLVPDEATFYESWRPGYIFVGDCWVDPDSTEAKAFVKAQKALNKQQQKEQAEKNGIGTKQSGRSKTNAKTAKNTPAKKSPFNEKAQEGKPADEAAETAANVEETAIQRMARIALENSKQRALEQDPANSFGVAVRSVNRKDEKEEDDDLPADLPAETTAQDQEPAPQDQEPAPQNQTPSNDVAANDVVAEDDYFSEDEGDGLDGIVVPGWDAKGNRIKKEEAAPIVRPLPPMEDFMDADAEFFNTDVKDRDFNVRPRAVQESEPVDDGLDGIEVPGYDAKGNRIKQAPQNTAANARPYAANAVSPLDVDEDEEGGTAAQTRYSESELKAIEQERQRKNRERYEQSNRKFEEEQRRRGVVLEDESYPEPQPQTRSIRQRPVSEPIQQSEDRSQIRVSIRQRPQASVPQSEARNPIRVSERPMPTQRKIDVKDLFSRAMSKGKLRRGTSTPVITAPRGEGNNHYVCSENHKKDVPPLIPGTIRTWVKVRRNPATGGIVIVPVMDSLANPTPCPDRGSQPSGSVPTVETAGAQVAPVPAPASPPEPAPVEPAATCTPAPNSAPAPGPIPVPCSIYEDDEDAAAFPVSAAPAAGPERAKKPRVAKGEKRVLIPGKLLTGKHYIKITVKDLASGPESNPILRKLARQNPQVAAILEPEKPKPSPKDNRDKALKNKVNARRKQTASTGSESPATAGCQERDARQKQKAVPPLTQAERQALGRQAREERRRAYQEQQRDKKAVMRDTTGCAVSAKSARGTAKKPPVKLRGQVKGMEVQGEKYVPIG